MNLSKSMTVPQGIVLAVCTLIGSGLLGLPGLAIETAGPQAAALAWPLMMIASLPLVIIFSSLSLRVQDSGGIARYAGMALGMRAESATIFILALTFMLCIPLGTFMGAIYIQKILSLPEASVFWIAALILIGTTLVNAFGIKPASWINKVSTLSLLLLIILFVASRPELISVGLASYGEYIQQWKAVKLDDLWGASALLFWAFLGWENLSFGSEEVQEGRKTIIAVFVWGFMAVTSIYAVLAIIAAGANKSGLSVAGVSGLLALMEGSSLAILAHILIVLIVIANVNAWVFAASRLIYASGRSRILPAFLGTLSTQSTLPHAALFSMLVVYLTISAALALNMFGLAQGLMIANQNFIIIYTVVIICHAQSATGLVDWLVVLAAIFSSLFLISGFGVLLLVPLLLAFAGYFVAVRKERTFAK